MSPTISRLQATVIRVCGRWDSDPHGQLRPLASETSLSTSFNTTAFSNHLPAFALAPEGTATDYQRGGSP